MRTTKIHVFLSNRCNALVSVSGRCLIEDLNDMVSEINFLPFFSGSVLHIESADKISCPATHQPVEDLE